MLQGTVSSGLCHLSGSSGRVPNGEWLQPWFQLDLVEPFFGYLGYLNNPCPHQFPLIAF